MRTKNISNQTKTVPPDPVEDVLSIPLVKRTHTVSSRSAADLSFRWTRRKIAE